MDARVDLISDAGDEAERAFSAQIARLGYEVRMRSSDRPGSPSQRGEAAAILFLAESTTPQVAKETLSCCHPIPDLVVMPAKPGCWDPALLARCPDVICWPCSDLELGFRISRLSRQPLATEDRGAGDAGLIAEFSSLGLIGQSPAFVSVLRRMSKIISALDVPVLIEGETGTGKELVARALHYRGRRSGGPFIPANCGAIPDSLVEGELFGHERGAFTDAKMAHAGLVEQADGGTLFLDEVEALTPRGQVALLRFLQNQEYRPVGGKRLRQANVRVLAATNRSLPEMVEQGGFRDDLYFRLNVVPLTIPPLRSRRSDVILLAEYYLREFSSRYGVPCRPLSPQICLGLRHHPWPGNIRELENFVHRLVVTGDVALGTAHDSDPQSWTDDDEESAQRLTFGAAKARAIRAFETEYLRSLLATTKGNITEAAARAGKERRALGKLIKKHGIHRTQPTYR
jgi:DNA-binding NtrC family response regulator